MRINLFLLPFLVVLNIISCQNEARWYPDADVTIASIYEHTDTLTNIKQLFVTFVIHNTSDTSINGGAVTLSVKTDRREYLQTVAVNTRIIPGGKIAINVSIAYFENSEQVQTSGISVYSKYFD